MTRERIVRTVLMSAAMVLGVVGCPPVPLDDGDAGVGGSTTGGVATGGAAATAGTAGCPGTAGPSMVRLPEGYCIDSTEVTRGEYAAWLATNPSTAGQIADCAWNTTFQPDSSCMRTSTAYTTVCQTGCDNHPQVCVDWCDAYAYCKAVGKRLCGKIGGGSNAYGNYDYADATLSQWYNACTSHNPPVNTYPYGATYDAEACHVGGGTLPWTTVEVGSLPGCQSSVPGYTGVYDLSGNVWEWEDSCGGGGQSAYCRIRGGYACAYLESGAPRDFPREYTGLRCCAEVEGSGTGGTGGEGASGGAGGATCSAAEQGAPPFTTTIRFTNPGPDPRWLHHAPCRIEFTLTSCSDGYQKNIANPPCLPPCPMCGGSCSPCEPEENVLIAAGSYLDFVWDGYDPVRTQLSDTCACLETPTAPAGLYRVIVPVWPSNPGEPGSTPFMNLATIVTQDFILDHAGGIVEVTL